MRQVFVLVLGVGVFACISSNLVSVCDSACARCSGKPQYFTNERKNVSLSDKKTDFLLIPNGFCVSAFPLACPSVSLHLYIHSSRHPINSFVPVFTLTPCQTLSRGFLTTSKVISTLAPISPFPPLCPPSVQFSTICIPYLPQYHFCVSRPDLPSLRP